MKYIGSKLSSWRNQVTRAVSGGLGVQPQVQMIPSRQEPMRVTGERPGHLSKGLAEGLWVAPDLGLEG